MPSTKSKLPRPEFFADSDISTRSEAKRDVWQFVRASSWGLVILVVVTVASRFAYQMIVGEGRSDWNLDSMIRKAKVIDAPDRFFVEVALSADGVKGTKGGKYGRHVEKRGWSGICAAPMAEEEVATRTCRHINRPVGPEAGQAVQVADCSGRWARTMKTLFGNHYTCPHVQLETITIEKVLAMGDAPNVIDYLSLDTHGNEVEVLKVFPFRDYCVRSWSIRTLEQHRWQVTRIHKLLESAQHKCHARTVGPTGNVVFARCPCDREGERSNVKNDKHMASHDKAIAQFDAAGRVTIAKED